MLTSKHSTAVLREVLDNATSVWITGRKRVRPSACMAHAASVYPLLPVAKWNADASCVTLWCEVVQCSTYPLEVEALYGLRTCLAAISRGSIRTHGYIPGLRGLPQGAILKDTVLELSGRLLYVRALFQRPRQTQCRISVRHSAVEGTTCCHCRMDYYRCHYFARSRAAANQQSANKQLSTAGSTAKAGNKRGGPPFHTPLTPRACPPGKSRASPLPGSPRPCNTYPASCLCFPAVPRTACAWPAEHESRAGAEPALGQSRGSSPQRASPRPCTTVCYCSAIILLRDSTHTAAYVRMHAVPRRRILRAGGPSVAVPPRARARISLSYGARPLLFF